MSGVVVGKYLGDVLVCIDANNNATCDDSEVSTRADSSGRYVLPVDSRSPVIAEIGAGTERVDPDSGTASKTTDKIVLRASAGDAAVISPITTQIASQLEAGVARDDALAKLAARIGVAKSKLMGDYHLESDALSRDLLRAHGDGVIALIQAALKANRDAKTALAIAAPATDDRILYAWTMFGSAEQPFSSSHVTATFSDGRPGSLSNEAPASGPATRYPNYTAADNASTYVVSEPGVGIGHQLARAIATGTACPPIVIDGVAVPMVVRAPAAKGIDSNAQYETGSRTMPIKADFDVLTCEKTIPVGATTASINGQSLRILNPLASVNRVVVVGDTGCRVKGPNAFGAAKNAGDPLQDCSDENAWPWRKLARAAASFSPDLIIHNGDIHYREGAPKGTEPGKTVANDQIYNKFADTITYGWKAWDADFFSPAGPLLAAAPWAITRGNHELCDRGGAGWYRFFDYRKFPGNELKYSPKYDAENCSNYIDPLVVRLGDLQLILLDVSSLADDPGRGRNQGWTNGDHVRTARQLNAVNSLPDTQSASISWLVSHKPLFGYAAGSTTALARTWQFQRAIQSGMESFEAGNGQLPANLQMIHSGHIHGWEMVSHPALTNLPTQYLIGMSGEALEGLVDGSTGVTANMPLAARSYGNNIDPSDTNWPWNIAKWFFKLKSGVIPTPDAFSSSPVVDAGKPSARIAEYGFVVFDRVPATTNWTARMYDPDRKLLRTCYTVGKRTTCDR